MHLWQHMLRFGSGKDAQAMLEDVADGPLDPSHYLDTVIS